MRVARATAPVHLDGRLDERAWQEATAYPLQTSRGRSAAGKRLQETGSVRLLWDDDALYVAVTFDDSDIVAEGEEDQLHHYSLGDVAEIFLRPSGSTWYWEFYATPHGRKSEFFFPGRGRVSLPSGTSDANRRHLRVAASRHGTLNDWKDRDESWTAELAIPLADLTEHGNSFGPGHEWHILVARYNYSRYLDYRELSAAPALPRLDFHALEHYAVLKFD